MESLGFRAETQFTERMINIAKIKDAYLSGEPSLESVEAQAKAKHFESAAFRESSSKEGYVQACSHEVKRLHKDQSVDVNSVEDERSGPIQQIGRYKATYHQSSLFSTVYKARGLNSSDIVALKLTVPSQCTAPHDPLREARILQKALHAHILPLLHTFPLAGGKFTLVFPFLPLDLDALLHSPTSPPPSPEQTRSHLRDIFSGLAHIHSFNIIHRDIKPSNILLASPSGPAYIGDFGIAWMDGDEASEPADQKITDVGTTAYRPPELLFGHTNYGCALDLWAAGCVVAEVVAGPPYPSLFDSGPLGSDLALIQSIFRTLGTPTDESWPEARSFPDWGKMAFYEYPGKSWEEVLPQASGVSRGLVRRLVTFESADRITAADALNHSFFTA